MSDLYLSIYFDTDSYQEYGYNLAVRKVDKYTKISLSSLIQ